MTAPVPATGLGALVSVVIPVHGPARLLTACLDSVLGQACGQVEVIAVDDRAPGDVAATLDRRAAADPRLRVLHLAAQGGPGPARNAGLAHARGDYVWFVDADDTLPPGTLAAIAARLAADGPDVLAVGHETVFPNGAVAAGRDAALLTLAAATQPATFRLADFPALTGLPPVSWGIVLRRAFACGLGVPFGDGLHEAVPVVMAALLAADRISVLDRVCYAQRQHPAALGATPGDAQFGVLEAWQRVFDFLSERAVPSPSVSPRVAGWGSGGAGPATRAATAGPGLAERQVTVTTAVRHALFEQAARRWAEVLSGDGTGGRSLVLRARRREFFHQMTGGFARLRPPGWQPPPGARGARLRLIERDAWWAYRLRTPASRLRGAGGPSAAAGTPDPAVRSRRRRTGRRG